MKNNISQKNIKNKKQPKKKGKRLPNKTGQYVRSDKGVNIVIDNSRKTTARRQPKNNNNDVRYYTPNSYPSTIPALTTVNQNLKDIKDDIKNNVNDALNKTTNELKADYNTINNQLTLYNNRVNNLPTDILSNIPNYSNKIDDLHDKIKQLSTQQNLISDAPINNLNNNEFQPVDKLDKIDQQALFLGKNYFKHTLKDDGTIISNPNVQKIIDDIPEVYDTTVLEGQKYKNKKKLNSKIEEYRMLYKELNGVDLPNEEINKLKNQLNRKGETSGNQGSLSIKIVHLKNKIKSRNDEIKKSKAEEKMRILFEKAIEKRREEVKTKAKNKSNKNNNIDV